jgi:hypothetical protein
MRMPGTGTDEAADPTGGRPFTSAAFAERERLAEQAIDSWAARLRDGMARVAVRAREEAEDLWADAQEERRRRDAP